MAIKVHCEGCGTTLEVKDEFAGKKGRCPTCKTILNVPAIEPTVPRPLRATPGRPPTKKQLEYAASLGVTVPEGADRAQVSDLIGKAEENRDNERLDRLYQLEDKESEHYRRMREEIEKEVSEHDPRVSSATPKQIMAGLEEREIAAILITMTTEQIEDALSGEEHCSANLSYTDFYMNEDEMRQTLGKIALAACKSLQSLVKNSTELSEQVDEIARMVEKLGGEPRR